MKRSRSPQRESPLKDKPLHLPGQALQRQLIEVIYCDGVYWACMATFVVVAVSLYWIAYYFPLTIHPIFITIVAVPGAGCHASGVVVVARSMSGPFLGCLTMARFGDSRDCEETAKTCFRPYGSSLRFDMAPGEQLDKGRLAA